MNARANATPIRLAAGLFGLAIHLTVAIASGTYGYLTARPRFPR